ncbi:Pyrrolidone-carboxylate peptidase, partial [Bifidobacterium kimbladii]
MGHMEQIKVIVAGYDHYEGVDVNPSYQVSQALAEHGMEGMRPVGPTEEDPLEGVDLAISSVTMPVSFAKAWPILHEAIERVRPDIIIATGLKRRARGIAMER